MSDAFIGEIIAFAGNFAPRGWQMCNGQLLPISQFAAVFSLLGTTYGGNGVTNFALPDLRGRVMVHSGQGPGLSPYVPGQTGGAEQVTLLTSQMPAHTHAATLAVAINVNDGRADGTSPNGTTLAQTEANAYAAAPDGTSKLNAAAVTATATIGSAGNSLPVPTLPPYLCINYIICMEGIFPSRN